MTVLDHCFQIAQFSDEPGAITRTFLSAAMRGCLDYFLSWADRMGMQQVHLDAVGNFRATLPGISDKRLVIGSHLDTVPNAGAFDGVLGVVLGMALAESFPSKAPPCTLEIVGLSEEEGVRFGRPFIGSVGFVSGLQGDFVDLRDRNGVGVIESAESFGLDVQTIRLPQMKPSAGYLEFHIEQGPVLESLNLPLGVVDSIAGQTRGTAAFVGSANHAGTTPMNLRQDAFCAAAEWALFVETLARQEPGLVATTGRVQVTPGAVNVIPGSATLSLDLRHALDQFRLEAVDRIVQSAQEIAAKRHVQFEWKVLLQQDAVALDPEMVVRAERAVSAAGVKPHRMTSGAGHDAMILARHVPSAMIFVRSPKGISHHPDESVLLEDAELALQAGRYFVENFI